ncbi:MAG TPA: hypothetical protein VIN70_02250 [Candidatus Limnocylindria bacterium]|jgi:hypothetical protein
MAKRQRRTTRERRAASASARPAAHDRPVSPAATPRRSYAGSKRAGSSVRPGVPRAVGEPSPILEREAIEERTYVTRDFRRIGVVVAVMVALLILSDIAVNALLP